MQERMTALKQQHANGDQRAFLTTIDAVAPGLRRYVRNRLRMAEHKKLIPQGLYAPDDIVDDVLLSVYTRFEQMPRDESDLRVKLFQLANEKLDELIQEESWHRQALSLEDILSDEMRMLDEIPQMTMDADGDILLVEELDDAELEPPAPRALLLEDSFEEEIFEQLGLKGALRRSDRALRTFWARIYDEIPAHSRIIFDLWTRGGLTLEEIARVRGLSVEQVRAILERISSEFQRLF